METVYKIRFDSPTIYPYECVGIIEDGYLKLYEVV